MACDSSVSVRLYPRQVQDGSFHWLASSSPQETQRRLWLDSRSAAGKPGWRVVTSIVTKLKHTCLHHTEASHGAGCGFGPADSGTTDRGAGSTCGTAPFPALSPLPVFPSVQTLGLKSSHFCNEVQEGLAGIFWNGWTAYPDGQAPTFNHTADWLGGTLT